MFRRIKDVEHPDEPMLSVFRDYGVVLKESRENLNKTAEDRNIYQLVHPGWLIVNRMKAWQGSVGISPHRGIVSGHYLCFAPKHDENAGFLNWLFRSSAYTTAYHLLSRGVRPGQAEIDNDRYRQMPVLLPPLDEQRRIADFLDNETGQIDALIAKQKQLIECLCERRSALLAVAFEDLSRGLTKLRYVADIQAGVTLSGKDDEGEAEWPYLRVANVQAGYLDLSRITRLRFDAATARASMLRPGDVLMTEGGDIDKLGRGAIWRGEIEPMLHQNHVFAVRPSTQLNSDFLVFWLDAPVAREYFYTTAKKTTNLASTNRTIVGRLPVPLPPIDIQLGLVARVRVDQVKIDAMIAKAEEFIALARERRAALITAAVTGRIDVSTGKAREGA